VNCYRYFLLLLSLALFLPVFFSSLLLWPFCRPLFLPVSVVFSLRIPAFFLLFPGSSPVFSLPVYGPFLPFLLPLFLSLPACPDLLPGLHLRIYSSHFPSSSPLFSLSGLCFSKFGR